MLVKIQSNIKNIYITQAVDHDGDLVISEFIIKTPAGRYYQAHNHKIAAIIDGVRYLDSFYYNRLGVYVRNCNNVFLQLSATEIKAQIKCGLIKYINLN